MNITNVFADRKIKSNFMIAFIAVIAATGGLLFGFDTGVISGALLFIKQDWPLSSFAQGCIVSSVLVGAVLGSLCSGKLTDHFGRKAVIFATAIIFFIGSIATAASPSPELLMLFRIIIGIAIGVASYTVPLYISEISPDESRGALVSLNQLAITIGILVSYFVDNYFASFDSGWRYMMLAGAAPAVILALGMLILPNTPRWLVSKNYTEEAKKVLKQIDSDSDPDKTITQIKKSMDDSTQGNLNELLQPWLRPALLIGIALMFFQQVTGINTVIYYAPTIFQMAGFQSASAAISATVGVGIINVLLTIVSIRLIDKVGRKPLLYIGLSGMIVSLLALGLAFYSTAALGGLLKWFTVGGLFVYIASFAISLGPICWLIIAEIYPTRIRGLAMSIATVTNWGFNLVVALTFLPMIDKLGQSGTFLFFALISILGLIFCYKYVPETKGVSLEDIEQNWRKAA